MYIIFTGFTVGAAILSACFIFLDMFMVKRELSMNTIYCWSHFSPKIKRWIKNLFRSFILVTATTLVFGITAHLDEQFAKSHQVVWLWILGAILIMELFGFFFVVLNMLNNCVHKIKSNSVGQIALNLFLIGALSSAMFIIFFALLEKEINISACHTNTYYIYNSAQYFFNTGDTTSGVKNSGLILHVIESAIGYSFYPSYLGMIIYIISARSNNAKPKIVNVEGVMCAKKPFLNKIKELIMDCD